MFCAIVFGIVAIICGIDWIKIYLKENNYED